MRPTRMSYGRDLHISGFPRRKLFFLRQSRKKCSSGTNFMEGFVQVVALWVLFVLFICHEVHQNFALIQEGLSEYEFVREKVVRYSKANFGKHHDIYSIFKAKHA